MTTAEYLEVKKIIEEYEAENSSKLDREVEDIVSKFNNTMNAVFSANIAVGSFHDMKELSKYRGKIIHNIILVERCNDSILRTNCLLNYDLTISDDGHIENAGPEYTIKFDHNIRRYIITRYYKNYSFNSIHEFVGYVHIGEVKGNKLQNISSTSYDDLRNIKMVDGIPVECPGIHSGFTENGFVTEFQVKKYERLKKAIFNGKKESDRLYEQWIDQSHEVSKLEEEFNKILLNMKRYDRIENLMNYCGKKIKSISLVERFDDGTVDITTLDYLEELCVDSNGHLEYTSEHEGYMQYEQSIGKYISTKHFISTVHNFIGFIDIEILE